MAENDEPTPPLSDDEDRRRRIVELEARLNRPTGVGVLPPVAALALVGTLAVLFLQRGDVEYFFSSKEPIDLGAEGAYHFDRAQTNRYTQLHGAPTLHGAYLAEKGSSWVVVGVLETPVLVKRGTFPNEAWRPGTVPPQPDQRPFTVRGRLLGRADAARYEDAFVQHEKKGEVNPKWLLVAELRPGGDLAAMAWTSLLFAFAAVNVWLFVRGLVARRRR